MKSKELILIKRALRKGLEPHMDKPVSTVVTTTNNGGHLHDIALIIKDYLDNSDTVYTEDSLWKKELKFIQGFRPHCIKTIVEDSEFKELTFEFLEKDDVTRFKTVLGTMLVEADSPGKLWKNLKEEVGDGLTRVHIRR